MPGAFWCSYSKIWIKEQILSVIADLMAYAASIDFVQIILRARRSASLSIFPHFYSLFWKSHWIFCSLISWILKRGYWIWVLIVLPCLERQQRCHCFNRSSYTACLLWNVNHFWRAWLHTQPLLKFLFISLFTWIYVRTERPCLVFLLSLKGFTCSIAL